MLAPLLQPQDFEKRFFVDYAAFGSGFSIVLY